MAKAPNIKRPVFSKTPFGGVPTKSKIKPLELLPSRTALNELTKGNPAQRSVMQFAAKTPIGANTPNFMPGSKVLKNGF